MAKRKTVAADVAATAVETTAITSIKGFDKNLQCRGFQFEVGKTFTHDGPVKACSSGFHAYPVEEHPLTVFNSYAPAGNRFCEVTQGGATNAKETKLASATITIDIELSIGDLVKRAWDYVWSRATLEPGAQATGYQGAASATGELGAASATGNRGAASATGELGAASATGYQGAASATGNRGAASATGNRGAASATGELGAASATGELGAASATGELGAASATGYQGAASATGYQGAASATGELGAASATGELGAASALGKHSAAMASGFNGKAQAVEGSALFLVERIDDFGPDHGKIIHVWAGVAGLGGIKAGVFYTLRDGQPVEVV
jgi:hypothetical protein